MKKLLIALTAVSLMMTACQKEASFEDPNSVPGTGGTGSGGTGGTGGGTTTGTKLYRIGVKFGTDSVTTDYTYNSANLLSNIHQYGTIDTGGGSFFLDAQIKVVRNSSNIIIKTVSTANLYALLGFDSLVVNYVYDATASRYKYGLTGYAASGVLYAGDSLVFNYDAAGKLVSGLTYTYGTTGYVPDSRVDYTYSGNNIATEKLYSYNGSSFDLDETDSYDQYDTNVNPLLFPADAPVLGMTTYYSANNVTKKTVTDYTGSSPATSSGTFTYTYNSNNRPSKATTSGSTSSYYYQ